MSISRAINSLHSFMNRLEAEGERISALQNQIEDLIAKVDSLHIDAGFEHQESAEKILRKMSFELSGIAIQLQDYGMYDLIDAYDELDLLADLNSRRKRK